MSRVKITDDDEERLFSIFDSAQDLQRRILRMLARGFYHEHSVQEMRWKIDGITKDIADLSISASVDRNPEGEKPQALSAQHESAVPKADAKP